MFLSALNQILLTLTTSYIACSSLSCLFQLFWAPYCSYALIQKFFTFSSFCSIWIGVSMINNCLSCPRTVFSYIHFYNKHLAALLLLFIAISINVDGFLMYYCSYYLKFNSIQCLDHIISVYCINVFLRSIGKKIRTTMKKKILKSHKLDECD